MNKSIFDYKEMSEFPPPIPRTDGHSSAAAQAAGPYPPANGQHQQHRSDRSQSADGRRLRGYHTAGGMRPSALRRGDFHVPLSLFLRAP